MKFANILKGIKKRGEAAARQDRMNTLRNKFGRQGTTTKSGFGAWARGESTRTAPRTVQANAQDTRSAKERYRAEQSSVRRKNWEANEAQEKARLKKFSDDSNILNRLDIGDSRFSSAGKAFSTGLGSLVGGMKEEGALKKAGIGIAQSAAASAAGHAGLAAIQGEDPWEAAKTGAVRGAFVGTGYQGLKVATGAQNVKGVKNTLNHIGSTSKQVYQAHTPGGNANMRGNMSNQLKRVLEQNKRAKDTGGIFGLK